MLVLTQGQAGRARLRATTTPPQQLAEERSGREARSWCITPAAGIPHDTGAGAPCGFKCLRCLVLPLDREGEEERKKQERK